MDENIYMYNDQNTLYIIYLKFNLYVQIFYVNYKL